MTQPTRSSDDYSARLAAEEEFFRGCEEVHDLPAIFHYWSNKYVRPKLQRAGFNGIYEFFDDTLGARCESAGKRECRFVSIGSGNCDYEIGIASRLREAGTARFVIDCLDLNETMLERGRSAAAQQGLGDTLDFIAADFNNWQPQREYDGIIANQALHHVVNLEGLFAAIQECLLPGGCFVISDMIGRNGHRRWPEAMSLIHEYWRHLPVSYRYNRQLSRYEEWFEDWDCSQQGFEGIRAQDILPLLLERFSFQKFVAYGNVIDPFVDRSFGPNFDVDAPWDRNFIDTVHQRDEQEIRAGSIPPVHMFAVVGKEPSGDGDFELVPARCVRRPDPGGDPFVPSSETPYASHTAEAKATGYLLSEMDRRLRHFEETAREQYTVLEKEFDDRTKWALSLNDEVKHLTACVAGLQTELDESNQWALRLDQELKEISARPEVRLRAVLNRLLRRA